MAENLLATNVFKTPVLWNDHAQIPITIIPGPKIECRYCGYAGRAEEVTRHTQRGRTICRCPKCKSTNLRRPSCQA